jgi:hypothetical protein
MNYFNEKLLKVNESDLIRSISLEKEVNINISFLGLD